MNYFVHTIKNSELLLERFCGPRRIKWRLKAWDCRWEPGRKTKGWKSYWWNFLDVGRSSCNELLEALKVRRFAW